MKPKTLTVKAAFVDRPVFMPHQRQMLNGVDRWIIKQEPMIVPNTRYYQRRIAMGDLVIVEPTAVVEAQVEPTKTSKKAGK